MARRIAIRVDGLPAVQRALAKHNVRTNPRILRDSLSDAASQIARLSKRKYIHPGGNAPPLPRKLTSRTDRLRDSIAVDLLPLPKAVEIGTDVEYAPQHELGFRPYPKRPFLQPATDDVARKLPDIIAFYWERETFS